MSQNKGIRFGYFQFIWLLRFFTTCYTKAKNLIFNFLTLVTQNTPPLCNLIPLFLVLILHPIQIVYNIVGFFAYGIGEGLYPTPYQ
jgi:hypothetical protein